MPYLKHVSFLLLSMLLMACSPHPYEHLKYEYHPSKLLSSLQPDVNTHKFRCVIDGKWLWKKYHLSGLLLMKRMDDRSVRFVFQNEMGVTFFDLALHENNHFEPIQVMDQMNKTALLKTLEKFFKLLLVRGFEGQEIGVAYRSDEELFRLYYDQRPVFYIQKDHNIHQILQLSGRKKVVGIKGDFKNHNRQLPESLIINGYQANFTITLNTLHHEPTAE